MHIIISTTHFNASINSIVHSMDAMTVACLPLVLPYYQNEHDNIYGSDCCSHCHSLDLEISSAIAMIPGFSCRIPNFDNGLPLRASPPIDDKPCKAVKVKKERLHAASLKLESTANVRLCM